MWVWLYRNSAPLSSYFSDIPPVYTEYSAISKKQEMRSLRNDLLLHMALYSLAIVIPLVCSLLAPFGENRITFQEHSQLSEVDFFCQTEPKGGLRGGEK